MTIPMIRDIRQKHYIEPEPNPVFNSFKRLWNTFKNIRDHRAVFVFLLAYFLYIDGVDTIIKMVVPYATAVLGTDSLDTFTLLGILLIIQIIAFPCAILYGNLARRFGTRRMIITGIWTYIVSCITAYFISEVWHIFILGAMMVRPREAFRHSAVPTSEKSSRKSVPTNSSDFITSLVNSRRSSDLLSCL